MTTSARRTATFLLRQPRQVQGFREKLRLDEEVFLKDVFAEDAHNTALTMLWIPPGRFWMGSPPDELERSGSEGPQHLVQLQGFFMAQMPITQAQWRAVAQWQERPGESWGRELDRNPSRFDGEKRKILKSSGSESEDSVVLDGKPNTDQRPVERVSWLDAMEFCSRLRKRTGRYYTLPSEAQWEYACRAGTSTPFHFGPTLTPELANYNGSFSYADGPKGEHRKQTTPVGMFPANAWGLHDMHGNVLEWCLDHWHGSYAGAPIDGSAWLDGVVDEDGQMVKDQADAVAEPESSSMRRLLRGGSWYGIPRYCRSASRGHYLPVSAGFNVGFRVVCLPQDPSLNP